ncbi:DUF368 domain-containing protein [Reinekea marinisedimentorum]|uniref:Putative membrane protein n=1 Tax=Reinekea marinisedimentorum TaxID=230495 RepID=A0A4R3I791_9GAMM|nr:DUF368 domain-containing protein [Reinekea marinisedimentorum]TCS40734.1 putative membrane protein [Reinekea marinisedimentorum]
MRKQAIGWILKGAAMGAADAVPGVSGGTIALITGIYERFIAALAGIRPALLPLVIQGKWKKLWLEVDGNFLLCLGIGILFSLITVLNLLHVLLAVAAPVVWSFFMGVILLSLVHLVREHQWGTKDLLLFASGLAMSVMLVFMTAIDAGSSPLVLFLGGALAISAMLLPGISGSFILLLLGIYPQVVEAVHEKDLMVILWVGLGCVAGILSFSKFLQWLMSRWHDSVLSFMLGVIAGALIKVWPWQGGGSWYGPLSYEVQTGEAAWLLISVLVFLSGCLLTHFLYKRSGV